jgi:hypothetical protein
MAEAIAMKEGLALALRLGCNSVHAESDSSETIDACNGSESCWSEPTAIYADCIDLSTSIGSVSDSHISREANKAAHKLTRVGFLDKYNCNRDDEPPDSILSSLINDIIEL